MFQTGTCLYVCTMNVQGSNSTSQNIYVNGSISELHTGWVHQYISSLVRKINKFGEIKSIIYVGHLFHELKARRPVLSAVLRSILGKDCKSLIFYVYNSVYALPFLCWCTEQPGCGIILVQSLIPTNAIATHGELHCV
jgi:hypothetical protein